MKMTSRDKVFILVIVIALFIGGGFSMFVRPKFDEIKTAKSDYETVQKQLETVEQRVESEKNLISDINKAYMSAQEIASMFFETMEPQEVDEYVKGLLDAEGIFIDGMTISDYTVLSIDYYSYTPLRITYPLLEAADLNGENTTTEVIAVPQGEVLAAYTISFRWSADRDDICRFMDKLLIAEKKTLRINSIDFQDTDDESGEYSGVVMENASDPESEAMPIRDYAGSCQLTLYIIEPIAEPKL